MRLRMACAAALRMAAGRLGVAREGAPALAAACAGQHELEEDRTMGMGLDAASSDSACAAQEWAGSSGGMQESVRGGNIEGAGDHLRSSKSSTTPDIDVSPGRRKFGGLFGGLRARVRAAFGDG